MVDQLLTLLDVAHHLRVDAKTVRRLRATDPDFPRPFKVLRGERWDPTDIREWEHLQKIKARLEAGDVGGTIRDNSGQSGTTAPAAGNPTSRRADHR